MKFNSMLRRTLTNQVASEKRNPILTYVKDFFVIILVGSLLAVFIKAFLIRSFFIPSESMMPTLNVNDRIVVNQLTPKIVPLQHGDIVVFKDPGGWLPNLPKKEYNFFNWATNAIGITADDSNEYLVKRVIGLPGDRVSYNPIDGKLLVNGKLVDEPYLNSMHASEVAFSVTVSKDSVWVMGDNRPNSADSRYHQDVNNGMVPMYNVVGRAFVRIYPFDKVSWLDNFANIFD